MIFSMTGFGRATASSPHKKITIEIKSINSKQLDLTFRIPQCFREMEVDVRNEMASSLERGKVELTAVVENLVEEVNTTVNVEALRIYKAQIESLNEALGLPSPADWHATLLRLPDALKTEIAHIDPLDITAFGDATRAAIASINESRLREGHKLYDFFRVKIANIESLLGQIDPYESERVPKIRERLEEQLSRLTSIEYDRARLEQELIFYIEKLDVSEEKLRLRAHLNYFLETLGGEIPEAGEALGKGKKLGFIAQEMGREINTLGSKSNHAEMQKIVVKMKDELEQIKEQVLNVL